MTNLYRDLCAELLAWAEHTSSHYYKQPDVLDRARALLAQPVAEGPTDEELEDLAEVMNVSGNPVPAMRRALELWGRPTPQPPADGEVAELVEWLQSMRDLAGEHNPDEQRRYTRAAELLEHPTPQPVAVSERLPGPEDCDEQGRCWLLTVEDEYPQWRLHSIEGAQPGGAMIWVPVDSSPGVMVDCFYTSHWLPANALPTPEATND